MNHEHPKLQILGIDAAVDPRNTGFAVAGQRDASWRIQTLETGKRGMPLADAIMERLAHENPILLAIDAPLGWPVPLTRALADHSAGEPLTLDPRTGFARETDRFVREKTGLKPLDVGADRIARTAAAALALIEALRTQTGQRLPLLSSLEEAETGGLIEVYPAATLKQHGLPHRSYKKPAQHPARKAIVEGLTARLDLADARDICIRSHHCLDAAICVLAAIDFLADRCPPPQDAAWLREGWIWFAEPISR